MMRLTLFKRRNFVPLLLAVFVFLLFYNHGQDFRRQLPKQPPARPVKPPADDGRFHWSKVALHYPIAPEAMKTLPAPAEHPIPKIQYSFPRESSADRQKRLARLRAVKANFTHAWNGYKKQAWMKDEVNPITGGGHNPFGGWAATLVDALDSLWIMGMRIDFEAAVKAVEKIDFSTTALDEINVFETTIRYLGGFLAAYDVSEAQYPSLLRKAVELGDMLYVAFDTPNHLPITRWKFKSAQDRDTLQVAPENVLVAEIGSLTLEFTRLSQLSGDPKYYDAVQRIMDVFEASQDHTNLPGMWPLAVNAQEADFTKGNSFTIGGMADSVYEYLPKQFILLGGASPQYRDLYVKAVSAMKKNIFYRPMVNHSADILIPGDVNADGSTHPAMLKPEPRAQHLGCFAGGMVGIGSRAFNLPNDLEVAQNLVEGCLWGYENSPGGMMPEIMHTTICPTEGNCIWDEDDWHKQVKDRHDGAETLVDTTKIIAQSRLAPGVTDVDDRRYILRPEAIESIFILYRLTGDASLMDRAWAMFETIVKATQTKIAHAALDDCTVPHPETTQVDSMESFWLAETLKYFYLIFEDPDVISLDDYVLNTEAHPLRREKP